MSDDCLKHKKEVAGVSDMKLLAEMIENMSYQQHPELFKELSKRYKQRSRNDWRDDKIQLSSRGKILSQLFKQAFVVANEMWQISKPFMESKTNEP